MKVLLTGGSGNLGHALVPKLLDKGDTPIKEVLQLLKEKQWAIPANIEYEYKGADTVAEVKNCYEYCKSALA